MKKVLIITMIIMLLLTGCNVMEEFEKPVDSSDETEYLITIPSGSSTNGIGKILFDNDLIRNELVFKKVVKDMGYDTKLKAGEYKLSKSFDMNLIIEKIYKGDIFIETVKFTIVEGLELHEIIDLLIDENIIDFKEEFLTVLEEELNNYDLIKNMDYTNFEGFLFPDTYEIKKGASDKEIINKMLSRFIKVFDEKTLTYMNENDIDIYEMIILASIIEREVMVKEEQVIVSSVFHNRLDINMLLQSCATVEYVIEERKLILSNKDIAIDNEYNTYKYSGLPPGPICSPGEGAIKAAIYPEDTDYLFFVRSYEDDNTHIFTTNLRDHNNAARKLYDKNKENK